MIILKYDHVIKKSRDLFIILIFFEISYAVPHLYEFSQLVLNWFNIYEERPFDFPRLFNVKKAQAGQGQGVQKNYTLHLFFIFSLLYSHYVVDLIKKLELRLMEASVLLKIKFGHTQISVPKIGIPMRKTACINPWLFE